jgi:hypothetical protein
MVTVTLGVGDGNSGSSFTNRTLSKYIGPGHNHFLHLPQNCNITLISLSDAITLLLSIQGSISKYALKMVKSVICFSYI